MNRPNKTLVPLTCLFLLWRPQVGMADTISFAFPKVYEIRNIQQYIVPGKYSDSTDTCKLFTLNEKEIRKYFRLADIGIDYHDYSWDACQVTGEIVWREGVVKFAITATQGVEIIRPNSDSVIWGNCSTSACNKLFLGK